MSLCQIPHLSKITFSLAPSAMLQIFRLRSRPASRQWLLAQDKKFAQPPWQIPILEPFLV
jgi:hypothetical protein